MINTIKTLKEAKKYTYGTWGGNPNGDSYREGDCAYEVQSNDRWSRFYQCNRKNGYGINGLYCKQHALKTK